MSVSMLFTSLESWKGISCSVQAGLWKCILCCFYEHGNMSANVGCWSFFPDLFPILWNRWYKAQKRKLQNCFPTDPYPEDLIKVVSPSCFKLHHCFVFMSKGKFVVLH